MIGVAIGLIVIGLILGSLAGPFGFIVAIAGLILLVVYAVGFARRPKQDRV